MEPFDSHTWGRRRWFGVVMFYLLALWAFLATAAWGRFSR